MHPQFYAALGKFRYRRPSIGQAVFSTDTEISSSPGVLELAKQVALYALTSEIGVQGIVRAATVWVISV